MQFCRYLMILILCVFVQACASPHMCQELALGKIKFKAGNYRKAFCRLLPVAVYGNAEAEYAVGYMYYYGYGVPRDCDSGLFWMVRSAAQHYPPAICALELIRRGPAPCLECAPPCEACNPALIERYQRLEGGYFKDEPAPLERDAVLHPIHEPYGIPGNPYSVPRVHAPVIAPAPIAPRFYQKPAVAPAPVVPRPYRKPFSPGPIVPHPYVKPVVPFSQNKANNAFVAKLQQKTTETLAENSNTHSYSLQLFGAYQLADVEKVQEKLHLQDSSHIYHTQNKGKDWYILTVGKYATVAEAKLGMNDLSSEARGLGPWVKKIG